MLRNEGGEDGERHGAIESGGSTYGREVRGKVQVHMSCSDMSYGVCVGSVRMSLKVYVCMLVGVCESCVSVKSE